MSHQAPGRRSVLKVCNKQLNNGSPPSKKARRSSCICYVTGNNSTNYKTQPRRRIRKHQLEEYTENESSKGNIEDSKKYKRPASRKDSSDSVIYVGTLKPQSLNSNNLPVVDLTHSSDNLSSNGTIPRSKSLKTLYFPSRNFDKSITLRKRPATTSLINLPVIQKSLVPRRQYSRTVVNKTNNNRLSILSLPGQFLDPSDLNFEEENLLTKANLTESDQKIINWILDQEIHNVNNHSASYDGSSVDPDFNNIQDLCSVYDVGSNSNFD